MHTNRAKIAFVVTQAADVNVRGIFNSLLFLFEIHQTFYYGNNERRPQYVYFTRVKFDNSQFDLNLSAEFDYLKSVCVFGNTIIRVLSPLEERRKLSLSIRPYCVGSHFCLSGSIFLLTMDKTTADHFARVDSNCPRGIYLFDTAKKISHARFAYATSKMVDVDPA